MVTVEIEGRPKKLEGETESQYRNRLGRETGTCPRCPLGKVPVAYGRQRCEKHLKDERDWDKPRKRRRVEDGRCRMCGKPLLERTDITHCINCAEGTFGFKW